MLTSVSVPLALTLIALAISSSTTYVMSKLYKFTLDAPTLIKSPNEPLATKVNPFNSTSSESMTKAISFKIALSLVMVMPLLRIIYLETSEKDPLNFNSLAFTESFKNPSSSKYL